VFYTLFKQEQASVFLQVRHSSSKEMCVTAQPPTSVAICALTIHRKACDGHVSGR
jgi:hypothetical protein